MDQFRRFLRIAMITATLAVTCVLTTAFAAGQTAVTTDSLRLREQADASGEILTTAPKGAQVTIVEDAGDGWYKVNYAGRTGYMSAEYLDTAAVKSYVKTTDNVNLRSSASTDAEKLATVPSGTTLELISETDDGTWYRVLFRDETGFVSADYAEKTDGNPAAATVFYVRATDTVNIRAQASTESEIVGRLATGAAATLVDDSVEGWYEVDKDGVRGFVSADYAEITDSNSSSLRQQIVDFAMQYKGCPYVYGASGPRSFDCSGFTRFVFSHFGYSLHRSAGDQWYDGTAISKGELQPGDLLLFNSGGAKLATHAGLYIGGGKFIHASTSRTGVIISDLYSDYYTRVYAAARNIVG